VPTRIRHDGTDAESLREVSGKGKERFAVPVCRGGLRAGPPRALTIMKHLIIELSSFHVEMCLLSNDVHDYYFVSQGKTTIPNVDDGEECLLTDVRTRRRWRISQGSRLSFIFALPLYNDILRRDSLLISRWFSWINRTSVAWKTTCSRQSATSPERGVIERNMFAARSSFSNDLSIMTWCRDLTFNTSNLLSIDNDWSSRVTRRNKFRFLGILMIYNFIILSRRDCSWV
jgi:hypothetical protein